MLLLIFLTDCEGVVVFRFSCQKHVISPDLLILKSLSWLLQYSHKRTFKPKPRATNQHGSSFQTWTHRQTQSYPTTKELQTDLDANIISPKRNTETRQTNPNTFRRLVSLVLQLAVVGHPLRFPHRPAKQSGYVVFFRTCHGSCTMAGLLLRKKKEKKQVCVKSVVPFCSLDNSITPFFEYLFVFACFQGSLCSVSSRCFVDVSMGITESRQKRPHLPPTGWTQL